MPEARRAQEWEALSGPSVNLGPLFLGWTLSFAPPINPMVSPAICHLWEEVPGEMGTVLYQFGNGSHWEGG